jgi:hypothetical protein
MSITIDLTPEQEAQLGRKAEQQGQDVGGYLLAIALRETSREYWERRLRRLAIETGVSLSDEAVSSEGLYEDHL